MGDILEEQGLNPLTDTFSNLMGNSKPYITEEGRFACWFIEDIDTSESSSLTPYQRDLIEFQKKYCVDLPRPDNMDNTGSIMEVR